MRLAEGIELFLARKRDAKVTFKQPEAMLLHFSRQVGDVRLSEVTTQNIVNYLDPNLKEPYIWHVKYQLLRRLFEYWVFRGVMQPLLMPHKGCASVPRSYPTCTTMRRSAACSKAPRRARQISRVR